MFKDIFNSLKAFADKKTLSGADLKNIALVTMTMDHIAAYLLPEEMWYAVTMRQLGRMAFPIYCFLLTEGLNYTRKRTKYLLSLFLFAWVSQIPYHYLNDPSKLNVMFTLFLGAAAICFMDLIYKLIRPDKSAIKTILSTGLQSIIALGSIVAAFRFNTSYQGIGVFLIIMLYYLPKRFKYGKVLGCAMFCYDRFQMGAIFCLYPIHRYNGERGKQHKWFFYIYYPAHLLTIYLIKRFTGV